jgi:lysylphosphatidylglycerol synthetase-like protein (DUF2156 family)
MAGAAIRVASGKHTRRMELEAVRQVCLATLIMLIVQYGLGTILNLYIAVPAADAHASFTQEIANGPVMLTLHALLGVALIGAAIVLLIRAIRLEDRPIAILAAAGLTAIGGAFASGEIFVRNGQNGASLAMALLTGVALLCYIGTLTWVSTALRRRGPGA